MTTHLALNCGCLTQHRQTGRMDLHTSIFHCYAALISRALWGLDVLENQKAFFTALMATLK